MKFSENAEMTLGMSEEEIEAQIMGVLMIEHFNMKKGIDFWQQGRDCSNERSSEYS